MSWTSSEGNVIASCLHTFGDIMQWRLCVCWIVDLFHPLFVSSSDLLPVLCLGVGLTSLLLLPFLSVFLRRLNRAAPTAENQPKTLVLFDFLIPKHAAHLSLTDNCKKKLSLSLRRPFTIRCLWSPSPWFPLTLVTSMWKLQTIKSPRTPPQASPPTRTRAWPWETPVILPIMTPAPVWHTGTVVGWSRREAWTLVSASHLCLTRLRRHVGQMETERLGAVLQDSMQCLLESVGPHFVTVLYMCTTWNYYYYFACEIATSVSNSSVSPVLFQTF